MHVIYNTQQAIVNIKKKIMFILEKKSCEFISVGRNINPFICPPLPNHHHKSTILLQKSFFYLATISFFLKFIHENHFGN